MVLPGSYTAKLTVDGKSTEQTFDILMDPRLEREGVSQEMIQEQLVLQNKVNDLLSEARKFQDSLEKKIKETKDKAEKEALENVLKSIKNDDGAYPQQMMVAQISYLSNILGGSDKKPGNEEVQRFKELQQQFQAVKQKVNL